MENSFAVKTSTGGKTYERNEVFSGTLLGPEGGRLLALSQLHKETDSASYQTFSPELGSIVTITNTLVAREPVMVDGQSIPANKIEQTMNVIPGKILLWLDREGWMLRQITPSPLGDIEAVRSTTAVVPVEGAALPEETFSRSIVTSNVRLPQERLIERMRLKITQKRPDLGWPDFSAENQAVIEKTRDYVILEIRRPEPNSHGIRPVAMTDSLRPFLAPNALLQSDDQTVVNIAKQVAGENKDAWVTAQALQRWTNDNMHFDLGVAIAPASEVAKNRRGTCFGYSMLLGSLARAVGIPSRIRMGFVYAGGIWGGHAWVEESIADEWIPIDGALYAPGAADAARFSFFTSGLEEGTLGSNMASLAQLFGNVDVKILEYTVAGKTVRVPADAKPYTIEGNTYRNPWIGIAVAKPDSYSFSGFDLKWPQATLIAMDGPEKERIEIDNLSASLPTSSDEAKIFAEEEIKGDISKVSVGRYEGSMISNHDKTGLLLQEKGSVWMLTATGKNAKEDILKVAGTIRFD